jgi:hypothetical protein
MNTQASIAATSASVTLVADVGDEWLLDGGVWDDGGEWQDDDTWQDS